MIKFCFDLGVASIGWGVWSYKESSYKILSAGVYTFEKQEAENNQKRRAKRGQRRLKRRKNLRLQDVRKLLMQFDFIDEKFNFVTNGVTPYEIRSKGVREPLSKEEFAIALFHLIKRRGVAQFADGDTKDESELKQSLAMNHNLLTENFFVCDVQCQRLKDDKSNNKVRGIQNFFYTSDYVNEFEQLMKTQRNHLKIPNDFIEQAKAILTRKRMYFEGPSVPSAFGWGGNQQLWMETMMGKCTYVKGQIRAPKKAMTSELFNLLNDLNNLRLKRDDNEKLTAKEKVALVQEAKRIRAFSLKHIAKILSLPEEKIEGYRVKANGKDANFTELSTFHDFSKILGKEHPLLEERHSLDTISWVLTIYQTKEDRYAQLTEKFAHELSKEERSKLSALSFTGSHSLSLKAMNAILDDLREKPLNQTVLFQQHGMEKVYHTEFANTKTIPSTFLEQLILSPVAKKTITQAIKICNALIEKYGYPNEMVIEMTREKNDEKRKRHYQEIQAKNEKENAEAKALILSLGGHVTEHLIEKVRLWKEQDGFCLYSAVKIPIESLVHHEHRFESDHIIPKELSFDHSFTNKALVYREENQKKGMKTTFYYFNSGKATLSYVKWLDFLTTCSNISPEKKALLTNEENLKKWGNRQRFVNRNLIDTSYATKEFATLLHFYFKAIEQEVAIKTINGQLTGFLRRKWDISKDREADYSHHAKDALIIGLATELFANETKFIFSEKELHQAMNSFHVNLLKGHWDKKISRMKSVAEQIENYSNFMYGRQQVKNINKELYNETIYSTMHVDMKEHVVNVRKDIYGADGEKLKSELLDEKKREKFLMYHYDKKTFDWLVSICEAYKIGKDGKPIKNPFKAYFDEHGYIRTVSKKGEGKPLKKMRYISDELKLHKDISHKYPKDENKKDKRVVLLSLKPFRLDVYKHKMTGENKFLVIKRDKLKDIGRFYEIDKEWYQLEMERKGLSDGEHDFVFSLYRGDLFECNGQIHVYTSVKSEGKNSIVVERQYIDRANQVDKDRSVTVSKSANFQKKNRNTLGKIFNGPKEKRIFRFTK